jgi:hypothetical protein
VVEPAELGRPLDRDQVDRRLDHADQGVVAAAVEADRADLVLGQVPALAAEADALLHLGDRSARASASSFGVRRMWNASRCAVRWPTPGSRVSWATRFCTEGDNIPNTTVLAGNVDGQAVDVPEKCDSTARPRRKELSDGSCLDDEDVR